MSKEVSSHTITVEYNQETKQQAIRTTFETGSLFWEVEGDNKFITACTFPSQEQMNIGMNTNPNHESNENTLFVYTGNTFSQESVVGRLKVNQKANPQTTDTFTWTTYSTSVSHDEQNVTNSYETTYANIKFSGSSNIFTLVSSAAGSDGFNIRLSENQQSGDRPLKIYAYTGVTAEDSTVGVWTITQYGTPTNYYFRWSDSPDEYYAQTISNEAIVDYSVTFTSNHEVVDAVIDSNAFFTFTLSYTPNQQSEILCQVPANGGQERNSEIKFYKSTTVHDASTLIGTFSLTQLGTSGNYFIINNDTNNYETYVVISGGTITIPLSTSYPVASITSSYDQSSGYIDEENNVMKYRGEDFITSTQITNNNEIVIGFDNSYYRYPLSRTIPRGEKINFYVNNSIVGSIILKQSFYYFKADTLHMAVPSDYEYSIVYIYTNVPKMMDNIEHNYINEDGLSFGIVVPDATGMSHDSLEDIDHWDYESDGITPWRTYRLYIKHGPNTSTQDIRSFTASTYARCRTSNGYSGTRGYYYSLETLCSFSQQIGGEKYFYIGYNTETEDEIKREARTAITASQYESFLNGKLDWDTYDDNSGYTGTKFLFTTNYSPDLVTMLQNRNVAGSNTLYYGYIPSAGDGMNQYSEYTSSVTIDLMKCNYDYRQYAGLTKDKEIGNIGYTKRGYDLTAGQTGFSPRYCYFSLEPYAGTEVTTTSMTVSTSAIDKLEIPIYTNLPKWQIYKDKIYYRVLFKDSQDQVYEHGTISLQKVDGTEVDGALTPTQRCYLQVTLPSGTDTIKAIVETPVFNPQGQPVSYNTRITVTLNRQNP